MKEAEIADRVSQEEGKEGRKEAKIEMMIQFRDMPLFTISTFLNS